jgi:hypothetical protein
MPDHLRVARYRIALLSEARLALPTNPAAMLRGGLGQALKRGTCGRPSGELCQKRCELPEVCPYAFLFESPTPPNAEVLRASHEIPPPYLIEPPDRPPYTLEPGEPFRFGLVLFGSAIRFFPYLLAALRDLGQVGLGPQRIRCRLGTATFLAPGGRETVLFDASANRILSNQPSAPSAAAWAVVQSTDADRLTLTLHFLTPTRLKHADRFVAGPPPFHVVIRALMRRVSSLSYFYGGQRWEVDYRGWIGRAEQVQIADAEVRWVDWERFSTRQGREMNLGGIVGRVTYAELARSETGQSTGGAEGLGAFLPLLRLGELGHVGKGAVFGNGRYEIANSK